MVGTRALAVGTLIGGRYRIEEIIGRGGMGIVYRATQEPLGRSVALKVLRNELLDAPLAMGRFEREAKVASAFDHPAAVTIYDYGQHEGGAFLAMEWVKGPRLRDAVDRAPRGLTPERTLEIAWQLADVLAAAHAAGLVHRDLKPENVLLESTKGATRVRLLDFGLAFVSAQPAASRLTREGVVLGTPAYLSPEQARGERVEAATDVYALGCIVHELWCGHPPFRGTEMEMLTKQLYAPIPAIDASQPMSVAFDELRRAMLSKRALDRPTSAAVRDRLASLDPDPDRARARAKLDGYLGSRAQRMVGGAASSVPADREIELGVVGTIDPELVLGLKANDISAFVVSEEERPDERTRALFVPHADLETIATLAAQGLPVIADAEAGAVERLAALLRAGAADVVVRPVNAADLVRKVRRVVRDRARGRHQTTR